MNMYILATISESMRKNGHQIPPKVKFNKNKILLVLETLVRKKCTEKVVHRKK